MKVTEEGPNQRQTVLTIELEPPDLEPYLQRAYQRLVHQVTVPGFRKGKAPRNVVERLLGREALHEEAMELLVPEITDKALQERELKVSTQPRVEIVGHDPVVFKATIPLIPTVELGDYRSLRIPMPQVAVQEEEMEQALQDLLRNMTPWEPLEGAAEQEDLVVVDLEGVVEGEPIISQQNTSFVINLEADPLPGFSDAIRGMQPGESRVFSLTFPEDYQGPRVAGKSCQFTATAKEVKRRHLPELDDEFAKGVGEGFESLGALKKDMRERLQLAQEQNARRAHEAQVVEKLLESVVVELPPLLVEREVDHLLHEATGQAHGERGSQADVDQYIKKLGKSEEELRQELEPQAVERLTRSAVLAEIASKEEVGISDEAMQEELTQMTQETREGAFEIQRLFSQPQNRASLALVLRDRRVIERLAAIAQGEELEPASIKKESLVYTVEESVDTPKEGIPAQSEGGDSGETSA